MAAVDLDGPGPLGRQLVVVGLIRRMQGPTGTPVTAYGVARWDGATWTGLGTSQMQAVAIHAVEAFDDGGGEKLYVGGPFVIGAGYGLAVRDHAGTWSLVGQGLPPHLTSSNEVSALYAFDDGGGAALYAGGAFSTVDGLTVNRIAKWDGAAWSSVGGGVARGPGITGSASVRALATLQDGAAQVLFAGGIFELAGGVTVNHVGRWDGTAWSSLDGGMGVTAGTTPTVSSLAAVDAAGGASLFASGSFDSAGTLSSGGLAQWTCFATCTPCDTNCDGSVNPFDIQGFIDQLGPTPPAGCSPCAGDADGNGTVNPFDINAFLECL